MTDVSIAIGQIRDQRFDAYTPKMLYNEIKTFRYGDGTVGIGDAVDALQAVGEALYDTDKALREELGKLGVAWEGKAGGQAGAVLEEQAGFSSDANSKIQNAAQMIYQQGAAFDRTKNKLPEPEAVLKAAGGYTFSDAMLSLLGFETDHVKQVRTGQEAQAQAVEALNAYAQDSATNLTSVESVAAPQTLQYVAAPGSQVPVAPVDPRVDAPEVSDDTSLAQVEGGKGKAPVIHEAPKVSTPPPETTPTPPIGVPVKGPDVVAPKQTTAPSAAPSAPAANAPASPGGGVVGSVPHPGNRHSETVRPVPGTSSPGGAAVPPGTPIGGVLGGSPGSGSPAKPGGGIPGRLAPGVGGGAEGGVVGKPGGGEAVLGKGRVFGAGPQAPSTGSAVGAGFSAVPRGPGGVGAFGDSAAALGAAGAAGAVSGEKEREGRGFGKGVAGGGKPVRQMPIGDLPEEEARAARNAERPNPNAGKSKPILEAAAAQDEDDVEHVRRFGVDDKDLFSDPRPVAPELIAGDDTP